MTDTIRKIIAYYAHHEVRPETREKILRRLAATKDDSIATEAYQQLWDEIETEERIEKPFVAESRSSLPACTYIRRIGRVLCH